jgi:hypothetical protein
MTTNRKDLKAFVRYDGNGRLVPSSNILQRKVPKVGKWEQIAAWECCAPIEGASTTITGTWLLSDAYAPPFTSGDIVFPNHILMHASLNPNEVGLSTPVSTTMLYINRKNQAGATQQALIDLAGRPGTLTLTQGANTVTYGFTADSFENVGYGYSVYFDWIFGDAVLGTLTILSPSAGNFDTTTSITITIT